MQQATATIVNDIGLLTAEQIPLFRAFLESKAMPVRDSGSGQFFHVRPAGSTRWLPIERGRAGAPVTPKVLRTWVDAFNEAPLSVHALPLGAVPALTQISSCQGAQKSAAPLSRYLSDLRDDFALHAPLLWDDELSALENANRRWEYADVMLATRTTQDGD